MGRPMKPRHPDNPVGEVRRIRKATGAWTKQVRSVRKWLLDTLENVKKEPIQANRRYEYYISARELERIIQDLNARVRDSSARDALIEQVRQAYRHGTAVEIENLISITDGEYTRELSDVVNTQAFQRRMALIQARVFEEMQGFQGETGDELGRVLREAVENGRNPMSVVKDIRERFQVSRSRAERIARTEIGQAHRRARLDEDEDANRRLGIRTRLLWFSALSATTRPSHAQRHGQVYTQEEVREFYATGANAINCKCVQTSIQVDENGNPVDKKFLQEVRG